MPKPRMDPSKTLLLGLLFGGLALGGLREPWAWTAVSGLLWLLALYLGGVPLSPLKPWLPWLLWAAASCALSSQPLKCLYALSRWTSAALFFALACALWTEKEQEQWLRALAVAGFIVCAAAWVTGWTAWYGQDVGNCLTGLLPPYYNYTVFVEAAAACALLAWLSHQDSPKGRARLGLWALAGLLAASILAARSRGGLLALGAGAGMVLWRQKRYRRRILAGAAVLAAVLLLRPSHVLKLDRAAVFKRPQLWKAAAQIAGEHPFFGEGPGNFEAGFRRHNFRSHFRVTEYQFSSAHAHSEPLQILAETGWIGLGLFLFALAAALRRRQPASGAQHAAAAAAAAMAAQGLVDNMLHLPALALLFFSALACAAPPSAQSGPRVLWPAAAGLALALSAWIPESLAARYLRRSASEPERKVEFTRKASALFPADAWLRETLARAWLTQRPFNVEKAQAELEEASRLDPTNALYPHLRGELEGATGHWTAAEARAAQALELEPNFLSARLLFAECRARAGDKEQARAQLLEAAERRRAIIKTGFAEGEGNGYSAMITRWEEIRFEAVQRLLTP